MSWFYSKSNGVDLMNGLVEWWPLDEASGSRAGAHAGLTLTDNGGVTGADGPAGSLASFFNGGDFLSRASQSELNQTGSFTFCAAVRLDTGGANRTILAKYNVQTSETSYWFLFENGTGRLSLYIATGSGGSGQVNVQATTFGAIAAVTWYWVFFWYDHAASQVGVAVNNSAADTTSFTGPVYPSTADFRIGDWQHTGAPTPWDGRIQRVGLYSRVLTAPERAAIYNGGDGVDYPFS